MLTLDNERRLRTDSLMTEGLGTSGGFQGVGARSKNNEKAHEVSGACLERSHGKL